MQNQFALLRVMIVEDDPQVLRAVDRQLKTWGFSVPSLQVMDAATACGLLNFVFADDRHVDLVITDLDLGRGGRGEDVVREACRLDIPCIIHAGQLPEMVTSVPFVMKGSAPKELREVIDQVLNLREAVAS